MHSGESACNQNPLFSVCFPSALLFLSACAAFPAAVAAQQSDVASPCTTPSSQPPHMCHVCEPLASPGTNEVIRNKCSKVQLLGRASPQRFLPTIHSPPFSPLEPDCYPTRTSPQIEMVLLTGDVGTLCFQSPEGELTGLGGVYFYRKWTSVR